MRNTNISNIEHKRMTETPVTRLLIALSIPTVISMLMTSIYNMADTYFVSSLGESPVGAVGIVFSLQSIIQAVGFGLSMGCGSLVSRKLGEKKDDDSNCNSESDHSLYTVRRAELMEKIIFGVIGGCHCDIELEVTHRSYHISNKRWWGKRHRWNNHCQRRHLRVWCRARSS